jgi:hypothetical protein
MWDLIMNLTELKTELSAKKREKNATKASNEVL